VAEKFDAKTMKTPIKKRTRFEESSPSFEASLPQTVIFPETDLGPEEFVLFNIRSSRRLLIESLDTLKDLVTENNTSVTRLSKHVKGDFGDMDMQMFRVNQALGNKPQEFGTDTVYKVLSSLQSTTPTIDFSRGCDINFRGLEDCTS